MGLSLPDKGESINGPSGQRVTARLIRGSFFRWSHAAFIFLQKGEKTRICEMNCPRYAARTRSHYHLSGPRLFFVKFRSGRVQAATLNSREIKKSRGRFVPESAAIKIELRFNTAIFGAFVTWKLFSGSVVDSRRLPVHLKKLGVKNYSDIDIFMYYSSMFLRLRQILWRNFFQSLWEFRERNKW